MRERDKLILRDLERFRCMSRDDIAAIHFNRLKQPITQANFVLKRLRLQGYIEANTELRPYIYFPAGSSLKRNSQKIGHFLSIIQIYRDLRQYGKLQQFDVEPKYGHKGTIEPDIFAIWQGSPWFIEVQCSIYSYKVMQSKLKRYEQFLQEGKWRNLAWQPKGKEVFPYIWIIGEKEYKTEVSGIRVIQSRNVKGFLEKIS